MGRAHATPAISNNAPAPLDTQTARREMMMKMVMRSYLPPGLVG
jgi:hypothetical protein